jgi:hypothetical protein
MSFFKRWCNPVKNKMKDCFPVHYTEGMKTIKLILLSGLFHFKSNYSTVIITYCQQKRSCCEDKKSTTYHPVK